MRGRTIALLSVILCLVFYTLSGRSLSQTRGPQSREEFLRQAQEQRLKTQQKAEELRRRAEENRLKWEAETKKIRADYNDEAWQEALGATPEQWQVIKPKLGKVRSGVNVPTLRIDIYSYAGRASFGTGTSSHGSASAGNEGRADDGGQNSIRGDIDANVPGASPVSGTGGTSGTSSIQSQAVATAGFGITGSVLSKPVKKQVGDVRLGWQWGRPSRHTSYDKLSESVKVCEQLLDMLETKNPDPEQTRQRIEALRKIREQKQAEYRRVREELRQVVTPEQEAKLILMGYLD